MAIDLNTGAYESDKDLLAACHRLQAKQPNAITWVERISYDAVYAIGGTGYDSGQDCLAPTFYRTPAGK